MKNHETMEKVSFRLKAEDKARLQKVTKTPSKLIRQIVLTHLGKEELPTTNEIELLSQVLGELKHIGVNLNQIARFLNAYSLNSKLPIELSIQAIPPLIDKILNNDLEIRKILKRWHND